MKKGIILGSYETAQHLSFSINGLPSLFLFMFNRAEINVSCDDEVRLV